MKPFTLLLGLSVAVNAGLVAAFLIKPSLVPAAVRGVFERSGSTTAGRNDGARSAETSEREKRQRDSTATTADTSSGAKPGLWAALDSEDLPTLVSRLRAAGFSRAAVLGVINARLDARFADRFKALTGDLENTPFWKPDPMSGFNNTKFWEEYSQIYRERSRLLRELIGDDVFAWSGTDPTTAQRRQFGSMPKEKIDVVQQINDDYAEMTSQIRAGMQGITLPEDREKLALLEREKRADLAAILTPAELEEYEMRSSQVTGRLRNTLSIMDATEDEFRAIFKIQQAFNDRVNPMWSGFVSSEAVEDRRAAQLQMNEQLKAALPPDRYNEYLRSSMSEYQSLHRIAQKENVPAETVNRAFSLRDTIAAESVRIADDSSLTLPQKQSALTALAQKGRTQILSTLGPGAGEAYAQTARWLTTIERGMPVAFGPDGNPIPRPLVSPPKQ
jgi:hypothetical protein